MSIQNCERVMWRLRKRNPNIPNPTSLELERAVMYEIGTDTRTTTNTRKALKVLGWIKIKGRTKIKLTDLDLCSA